MKEMATSYSYTSYTVIPGVNPLVIFGIPGVGEGHFRHKLNHTCGSEAVKDACHTKLEPILPNKIVEPFVRPVSLNLNRPIQCEELLDVSYFHPQIQFP